jgi:exopolyphosphatase/guanosine-5'-triphosphate,3'-diphosphate pyrophosphatase
MRVATIDIGTNTVLLLVAERRGAALVPVEEHATITRLGQGVDRTRQLAPEAIARTNACLDAYAAIVRAAGAARVAVVGTSAMRDADGGEAVRAHVRDRFGVEARTISGDEEARLTFAGALSGLEGTTAGAGDVLVFDIGGGSTEVVVGRRGATALGFAHSFDIGSVRMTERHIVADPPRAEELAAVRAAARAIFSSIPRTSLAGPPVGIAGTVTTLAAVALGMETYDASRVHGLVLPTSRLEEVVTDLAHKPLAERRATPGLEPKRADVIVAGGLVALALLEHLGADEVMVSDRGVRWGLAEALASSC